MKTFDLASTVQRLLTPQEILAPFVFDENGIMHEDVRQGLLKIADFVINKTIKNISGLRVTDVCLTGSCSGYLYHNNSDIDIRIVVKNEHCSALAKDKKHFDMFLAAQLNGFLIQTKELRYQKRVVDVKMSSENIDFLSLYSIKNNQWLIKPEKDLKLTEDEIMEYYLKRKQEISEEFERIKQKYHGRELGKQINEFYIRTYERSIVGKPMVKDYFVFKLLHYERLLKPIGAESIRAYNEAFTLKSHP